MTSSPFKKSELIRTPVATSVNAGMDVIMVGWGFRDEEFLREKGAKRIIKQPSEILDIILGED